MTLFTADATPTFPSPGPGLTSWLVLLLAAPCLEEIVFRAGLQHGLHAWFGGHAAAGAGAIGISAVAFASLHAALNPSPWAWWTVLPALALGALYQRTRRVGPCVALHAFFNLLWLAAPPLPGLAATGVAL